MKFAEILQQLGFSVNKQLVRCWGWSTLSMHCECTEREKTIA